jgi:hypothetical protein
MRIWDEYGEETNASIVLRSAAVWSLQTVAMAAELLIFRFTPHRAPWPWLGLALLAPVVYALAVLAFFTAFRRDRLIAAAKCTGQSAVLAALLAWVSGGDATRQGWGLLAVMSAVIGVQLALGYRADRAEDRAARDRVPD